MRVGLDMLSELPLSSRGQAALDAALAGNGGGAVWRARKSAEARELIALADMAPPGRMRIVYLNLEDDLCVVCKLGVRTPRREADGSVTIVNSATIGLVYPEKALFEQVPGGAHVEILEPRGAWHPAIAAMPPFPQVMCLGDLPAGTRVVQILLIVFDALALKHIRLEAFEALGVMNVEAAQYWQERLASLPLTRRAFLEAD